MQEYIKRMIVERDDLKGKITKAKKALEKLAKKDIYE